MRRSTLSLALATAFALGASLQADASLLLTTADFNPSSSSTDTQNNDYSGAPDTLYFGQLQATQQGYVDFFYLGNEAGYTNWLKLDELLLVGGSASYSTAGKPDDFVHPAYVGSISVGQDAYAGFGFCTDGGASVGSFGGCAYNDDAASLSQQFNYGMAGYRSIGFAALNDALSDTFKLGDPLSFVDTNIGTSSSLWGLFWDDSGAQNDDNHDDFIAIARFRPVSVPEPATVSLLGIGLLGLAVARRKRAANQQ